MTMPTHIAALKAVYDEAKAAHDAAQKIEVETRGAEHKASEALRNALRSHVESLYREGEVLRTRSHGEIRIVGVSVPVWEPTTVNAVFKVRLKTGKDWGKTTTTSKGVVWDWERGTWRTGVAMTSGRIDWDDQPAN